MKNLIQQFLHTFNVLKPRMADCAKKTIRVVKKAIIKLLLLLDRLIMYVYIRLVFLLIITYALVEKVTELVKEIKSKK